MTESPPKKDSRPHQLSVEKYYRGVIQREVDVFPRALTLVESSRVEDQQQADQLLTRLMPHTGRAMRVGISGVPGVGKSTFIDRLGVDLIAQGNRVAVLAVDPSSVITGGSILGDKTRMARLSSHPEAFIRPSPSAGTLGGVATKTRESMLLCDAAGFDVILVETVGVGQSETVVAEMTDCFLALMLPGSGDELQAIKRGLLEWVDVIAVNKADGELRQAASNSAEQLRHTLRSVTNAKNLAPRVFTCSAQNGEGIGEVWRAIEERFGELQAAGELDSIRRSQNAKWLWKLVDERLRQAIRSHPAVEKISSELEQEVLEGNRSPEEAASLIVGAFLAPSTKSE